MTTLRNDSKPEKYRTFRIIPVTLAIARATSIIRQYPRSLVRFQVTHRLGIPRLSFILLAAPLTHGDIQNL